MAATAKTKTSGNIFLRMHPLQRVLLSLAFSIAAFFIIRSYDVSTTILCALLWDVFSITYIITSWMIFYTRPVADIERLANRRWQPDICFIKRIGSLICKYVYGIIADVIRRQIFGAGLWKYNFINNRYHDFLGNAAYYFYPPLCSPLLFKNKRQSYSFRS